MLLRDIWAEINIDNLEKNIKNIKKLLKENTKYMAVIKADAYGHGAVVLGKYFIDFGVDAFAVACISEALELRDYYREIPILLLGVTQEKYFDKLIEYNITPTINALERAIKLNELAYKYGIIKDIHININTGMNRMGIRPDNIGVQTITEIFKMKNLNIAGAYTHFATSDEKNKEYSKQQIEKFNNTVNKLKKNNINIETLHVSNSGSVIDMPECQYSMIRPGIIQFGLYPSQDVKKSNISLSPILSLKGKIHSTRLLLKGDKLNYGLTYEAKKNMKVATISVGYADGYFRALSNKGKIYIDKEKAYVDVIGRVSMDSIVIDISSCNVCDGDIVTIYSDIPKMKNSIDNIAKKLNTINYEILCSISKRVPRVYTYKGKIIDIKNMLCN